MASTSRKTARLIHTQLFTIPRVYVPRRATDCDRSTDTTTDAVGGRADSPALTDVGKTAGAAGERTSPSAKNSEKLNRRRRRRRTDMLFSNAQRHRSKTA